MIIKIKRFVNLSSLLVAVLTFSGCGGSDATPKEQSSPTPVPTPVVTPTPIITPSPVPTMSPEPTSTPVPLGLYAPKTLAGFELVLTQNSADAGERDAAIGVRNYLNEQSVFTRVFTGEFDNSSARYSLTVVGDSVTEIATLTRLNGTGVSSMQRETTYTFTNNYQGTWQQVVNDDVITSGNFSMRETLFNTNANGDFTWQVTKDEATRNVEVHLPANFDAQEQSPLVIAFHGDNVNGAFMRNVTAFNEIGDKYRPVIMYPNGSLVEFQGNSVRTWESSSFPEEIEITFRDKAFVNMIIDSAINEYNIDPEKIYITGHSRGSLFVNRLLCEMPERFAAAAITSGNLDESLVETCSTVAVPLIHSHNTEDPNLPFDGIPANEEFDFLGLRSIDESLAFYAQKNGCAPEPLITQLPDIDTDDSSTVSLYEFQGCDESTPLEHYRVDIASHSWAGSSFHHSNGLINKDIHWTELQWQFFSQF